jgi:hypothetical protein
LLLGLRQQLEEARQHLPHRRAPCRRQGRRRNPGGATQHEPSRAVTSRHEPSRAVTSRHEPSRPERQQVCGSGCAAARVRQLTRWNSATVMPSMVGGVRFGLCTGPGGTGGIAPRLGRFGPPGTAQHRRRSACWRCAEMCVQVCAGVCRCVQVCAGVCRCVCVCACVCVCRCVCVCVRADVHGKLHLCTCQRGRRWYTSRPARGSGRTRHRPGRAPASVRSWPAARWRGARLMSERPFVVGAGLAGRAG